MIYYNLHNFVLQENLCRRPTTILTQSSTYNVQNASTANDGNVWTDDPHCAHTEANYAKAWLQVDFRESYKINNVKIYYRKDGMYCIQLLCLISNKRCHYTFSSFK